MAPPRKDRPLNGRLYCRVERWELDRWERASRLAGVQGRSAWIRTALHLVANEVEQLAGVDSSAYPRRQFPRIASLDNPPGEE